MFGGVKSLERKIKGLEKEIAMHEGKIKKAKSVADASIHNARKQGAEKELRDVRAKLVVAKAKEALKKNQ